MIHYAAFLYLERCDENQSFSLFYQSVGNAQAQFSRFDLVPRAQFEAQQRQIAQLNRQIAALEARLAALEAAE